MDSEYEIGYGKPPKDNQFRKGQSGNPKGRPRGTLNTATLFRQLSRQTITIQEGGQARQVPRIEVALRQLLNKAASGDLKAIREVLLHDRLFDAMQDPADASNEPDHEKYQAVMLRLMARMNQQSTGTNTEAD